MELSCGEGSFICLHLNSKYWLYIQSVFYFSSLSIFAFKFSTSVYIIKMPRTKQSPRKNPRDLPNPTNWASNLRHNHCKYFYLIYVLGCDWMVISCRWMGIFCGRMGLSHQNKYICTLFHVIILPNFAIRWVYDALGRIHVAVGQLLFALRCGSTSYL